MKKYKVIKIAIFLSIVTMATLAAHAQPNPGGPGSQGGTGVPADGGSPSVPFDGGMSLMLLASGIGYCAKKMKQK